MKYTVNQVKNIGGMRFLKKRAKRIALLYALSIGWIPLVYWLINAPKLWIVLAPLVLVTLNVVWSWNQSRNLFYNKVRKNPELLE
jgi:hypothetical protein